MGEQEYKDSRERSDAAQSNDSFGSAFFGFFSAHRRIILVILILSAIGMVLWLMPANLAPRLLASLLARRGLVVLALIFILLALSLLWSGGQRLDALVFLYFNQHNWRSVWSDRLMWLATQIGNGLLPSGLAIWLWFRQRKHLAVEFSLGFLSLWLLVEFIKSLTHRARPFIVIGETQVVGGRERGRSFPSGHTAQAFYLATVFGFSLPSIAWLAPVLFILAGLVGFTRIYVGVHYPRDVVAGAILGFIWGVLSVQVYPVLPAGFL